MQPNNQTNKNIKRQIINSLENNTLIIKKNINSGTLTAAKPESNAAVPPDSNFKSSIKTNIQVDTL